MALHWRVPQHEHLSRFTTSVRRRIPPAQSGEGLRLRRAGVAALARERQYVLAEMIG